MTSGYASATTNSIAQHAGVGIGSLYEYFPCAVKDYALRAPDRLADPDLADALIELIRNYLLGEIA